jgi:energy-coupling factor transporter ATP-binding protein EcfA2
MRNEDSSTQHRLKVTSFTKDVFLASVSTRHCPGTLPPSVRVFDEATSDLDTASGQHIPNSIDAPKGEATVIIIAHRLPTVKNADRVYVLNERQAIEDGT